MADSRHIPLWTLDPFQFRTIVEELLSNGIGAETIRALIARETPPGALSHSSRHDLRKQAIALILSGRLQLVRCEVDPRVRKPDAFQRQDVQPLPEGPPRPMLKPVKTRERAEPPPEEPTFPAHIDAAAIAHANREAARKGVPFCEECAKAAAAPRTVRDPRDEPMFPANIDAAAMAEAQREAARDGVPFCEECARAAVPPPPPVQDEPVFPKNVDAASIAEGHRNAAALGLPFCEECMKN